MTRPNIPAQSEEATIIYTIHAPACIPGPSIVALLWARYALLIKMPITKPKRNYTGGVQAEPQA